jgi:DNA-binding NarL/FixJ family response regulator
VLSCSRSQALATFRQHGWQRPNLLVIDLPCPFECVELLSRLSKDGYYRDTTSVLISDVGGADMPELPGSIGANYHFSRSEVETQIPALVRSLAGRHKLAASVAHGEGNEIDGLTKRQVSIVELLLIGYSNKKIANSLGLSYGTVKNYVFDLTQRLSVKSRLQIVATIRSRGYTCLSENL